MNKSNHTVTLPVRDYEHLMSTDNLHTQLMKELRDAMIYSKMSPDSILIDSRKIINIYRNWLGKNDFEITIS